MGITSRSQTTWRVTPFNVGTKYTALIPESQEVFCFFSPDRVIAVVQRYDFFGFRSTRKETGAPTSNPLFPPVRTTLTPVAGSPLPLLFQYLLPDLLFEPEVLLCRNLESLPQLFESV